MSDQRNEREEQPAPSAADSDDTGFGEAEREREKWEEFFVNRMDQMREGFDSIFPPEFRTHIRSARREFWLAVRGLVDARLDAIETENAPEDEAPKSGKINVD